MESMLDHPAKGKYLVIVSKCCRFYAMTGDNLSFPPHTHAHIFDLPILVSVYFYAFCLEIGLMKTSAVWRECKRWMAVLYYK